MFLEHITRVWKRLVLSTAKYRFIFIVINWPYIHQNACSLNVGIS